MVSPTKDTFGNIVETAGQFICLFDMLMIKAIIYNTKSITCLYHSACAKTIIRITISWLAPSLTLNAIVFVFE